MSGTTTESAESGLPRAQPEVGLGEHGVETCVEPAQGDGGLGAQGHQRCGRRRQLALPDPHRIAARQPGEEELGVGVVRR